MNEHSTQLIDHAGATGNRKLMSPHYLTTVNNNDLWQTTWCAGGWRWHKVDFPVVIMYGVAFLLTG